MSEISSELAFSAVAEDTFDPLGIFLHTVGDLPQPNQTGPITIGLPTAPQTNVEPADEQEDPISTGQKFSSLQGAE